MATHLTKEQHDEIIRLYKEGYSYREIRDLTGHAFKSIARLVRGMYTVSERVRITKKRSGRQLSEKQIAAFSASGRRACQASGKYYTKPERFFKDLMATIGVGVIFPDYIKQIKQVEDSVDCTSYLLYQYPIQRYVLDYVDIERKVAININGDYCHANPLLYDHNNLGELQRTNVRQDRNKRIFLEKHGWVVVDIWESEIYWNKDIVFDKLRAVGITEARLDYTQEAEVQLLHRLPDWSEQLKHLWFKCKPSGELRTPRKAADVHTAVCVCGKEFEYKGNRPRKYCSRLCYEKDMRSGIPPKEELLPLVMGLPMVKVAAMYGVSDSAVKKWCTKHGIELGNRRGYWMKHKTEK